MVFHWRLSDNNSFLFSWILLTWFFHWFSFLPSHLSKHLMNVLRAPALTSISVTIILYGFINSSNIQITIIMSRYQYGYSWPSLTTPPYRPLHSADPQGYIPYRLRAAVCRFELDVLPFLVHVKMSTGVHRLWARSYFSSNVPRVWFI